VPAQSADRLKHHLFAQVEFYLHLPASFRRFGQAQDLPLLGFSSFQQSLSAFWAKPTPFDCAEARRGVTRVRNAVTRARNAVTRAWCAVLSLGAAFFVAVRRVPPSVRDFRAWCGILLLRAACRKRRAEFLLCGAGFYRVVRRFS
jgi:hypothetical protein